MRNWISVRGVPSRWRPNRPGRTTGSGFCRSTFSFFVRRVSAPAVGEKRHGYPGSRFQPLLDSHTGSRHIQTPIAVYNLARPHAWVALDRLPMGAALLARRPSPKPRGRMGIAPVVGGILRSGVMQTADTHFLRPGAAERVKRLLECSYTVK